MALDDSGSQDRMGPAGKTQFNADGSRRREDGFGPDRNGFYRFDETQLFVPLKDGEGPQFALKPPNNDLPDGETVCTWAGIGKPTRFPFNPIEAYRAKIYNLVNGALLMQRSSSSQKVLPYKDGKDMSPKAQVDRLLKAACEKLDKLAPLVTNGPISPAKLGSVLKNELMHFADALMKAADLTQEELDLGEMAYTWQHMPHPKRTTKFLHKKADGTVYRIEQSEIPARAALTDAQKQQLWKIRGKCAEGINKVTGVRWFDRLPAKFQTVLLQVIPAIPNNGASFHSSWESKDWNQVDWRNYEKLHPTLLRHIPGEANSLRHEIKVVQVTNLAEPYEDNPGDRVLVHNRSRRQGTPDPIYMREGAERQAATTENLRQMAGTLTDVDIEQSFQAAWGVDRPDGLQVLRLFLGLVTPAAQMKWGYWIWKRPLEKMGLIPADNDDTASVAHKAIAFDAQRILPNVRQFNLNVPLNYLGAVQVPNQDFIDFAKKFVGQIYSVAHRAPSEKHAWAAERLTRLQQAIAALQALKDNTGTVKGRNKNLYIAAYYSVITQLMDELATGNSKDADELATKNCKSSKDRAGTVALMTRALLTQQAMSIDGKFPDYFETNKEERSQFVSLVADFYVSGSQLIAAHDNGAGTLGLKDEGKFLDKDVRAELDRRDCYQPSAMLSKLNRAKGIPKLLSLASVKHNWKVWLAIGIALAWTVISIALIATGVGAGAGLVTLIPAVKTWSAVTTMTMVPAIFGLGAAKATVAAVLAVVTPVVMGALLVVALAVKQSLSRAKKTIDYLLKKHMKKGGGDGAGGAGSSVTATPGVLPESPLYGSDPASHCLAGTTVMWQKVAQTMGRGGQPASDDQLSAKLGRGLPPPPSAAADPYGSRVITPT